MVNLSEVGMAPVLFRPLPLLAAPIRNHPSEESQLWPLLTRLERYGLSVYLLLPSPDFSQPARPS
jgi:hypothetical protein